MLSFPELEIRLHECWILRDRTDATLTHLEYDTLAYLASIKLVKIISRLYNIFLKAVIILKIREEYTCPLELIHDMIKGKWKPIILWHLRLGATSLSRPEKDIDGITQKILLEQLKKLIEYEFIEKKIFEGYPLHVEYFLTLVWDFKYWKH